MSQSEKCVSGGPTGRKGLAEARLEFLATANHDLRQPLHAMSLFVSALKERANANPDQPISEFLGLLDKIAKSQRTVEAFLENLLDFSKLDSGTMRFARQTMTPAVVFARAQECFEREAQKKGVELSVVPCSVSVESDPLMLGKLMECLVSNAVKYAEKGKVLIGARRRNGKLALEVWNHGEGVPEESLGKIFEPFVREKGVNEAHGRYPGLGLGLAIAAGIAEELGIDLTVRSWPGRGVCFSAELTLNESMAPEKTIGVGETARQENPVILMIDDDLTVLDAMESLLDGWGCKLLTASSFEEALDGLRGIIKPPDLMILDYRLGGGANGIEVAMGLRAELGQGVPAALVTGEVGSDLAERAKEQGMVLLSKPIKPPQLRQLIRNAVAGVLA